MRRILAGTTAFVTVTGTLLVLPVYAAPAPEAEPVSTSAEEVPMGSVEDPAPAVDVQEGTTDPVAGVAETLPVLTVRETAVDEFSLVGVTWEHDPEVTDTLIQVRTQDDAGTWGEWTEVGVEDAEQDADAEAGAIRGGTAPLWTGPSTGVEVELVTRSGAAPTDVQLDLIDPGDSEADDSLGTPDIQDTADAATAMPAVYSRKQWGADESLMGWAPQYAPTIKAATIHHTADSNSYSADQVPAIMRSIYRYHAVSRGWGDIGYNVIADKYGRLWEGRSGGLASTVVGAHAGGFNSGTFGVSMLGNYQSVDPSGAMLDSVAAVIAWKLSLYRVDPRGTTVLTSGGGGTARYAAGTRVTLPTVFGHRDVGSTSCPGDRGYAQLGGVRAEVATLMTVDPVKRITDRYAADAGLRSTLGTAVGAPQQAAGVTWQVYQRGRLYSSPDTSAHLLRGGILRRYLAAGGPAALGAPTTDEFGTPDGIGRYNHFTRGASVYWSSSTGAHVVWGGIRTSWGDRRWEAGPLGYPTGPETHVAGGAYQEFQGGTLVFSPAGGVHALTGRVRERWRAAGAAGAGLFPSTEETGTPDGIGSYQQFTIGASVYRSSRTEPQLVWGAVYASWAANRWEAGPLGYPVSAETAVKGGVSQQFERGVVVWSAAGGAHPITGRMLTRWQALGGPASGRLPRTDEVTGRSGAGSHQVFSGELGLVSSTTGGDQQVVGGNLVEWLRTGAGDGPLGYPLRGETYGKTASTQEFRGGTMVWSPSTGSHELHGAIRGRWLAAGGVPAGLLPSTSETPASPGGASNAFGNGSAIYWSQATGAQHLWGGILEKWRALGAQRSTLGFPSTGEYRLAGGRGNGVTFQGGVVYWSAATGAHEVRGSINVAYQQAGGAASALGLPTSDEYDSAGGRRSDFQRGHITWTPQGGVVVHTR